MSDKKVFSDVNDLIPFIENAKKQNQSIVFTNGCFDILHVGHLRYLSEAARYGDILIVGINSDDSVSRIKGPLRPINTLADRAELLTGLGCVDCVIPFCEDTPIVLIQHIIPQVLVKGADWNPDDIVGKNIVEANGGKVKTITLAEGRSTTAIIAKIFHATKSNERKNIVS